MSDCARNCVRRDRHVTDCPDRDDCPGCLPRTAEYGELCWPCHRRLELMLTDMPTVDAWLATHLPVGTRRTMRQDWERRASAGESMPVPVDLEVVDHRETIRAVLAGWVDALVDQTSLTGPTGRDAPACAAYLLAHLRAVECQVWVGEAFAELAEATSQAHALAPWRPQRRPVRGIPCPECQREELVIFGGEEDVTCLACREIMTPGRYAIWTRMLEESAG